MNLVNEVDFSNPEIKSDCIANTAYLTESLGSPAARMVTYRPVTAARTRNLGGYAKIGGFKHPKFVNGRTGYSTSGFNFRFNDSDDHNYRHILRGRDVLSVSTFGSTFKSKRIDKYTTYVVSCPRNC